MHHFYFHLVCSLLVSLSSNFLAVASMFSLSVPSQLMYQILAFGKTHEEEEENLISCVNVITLARAWLQSNTKKLLPPLPPPFFSLLGGWWNNNNNDWRRKQRQRTTLMPNSCAHHRSRVRHSVSLWQYIFPGHGGVQQHARTHAHTHRSSSSS